VKFLPVSVILRFYFTSLIHLFSLRRSPDVPVCNSTSNPCCRYNTILFCVSSV